MAMGEIRESKSFSFIVFAVLACTALACEAQSAFQYELRIRPSICVSYDSTEPCTMMLKIDWTGDSRQPVCLKLSNDDIFLECWSNVLTGNTELPYENTEDLVYQLVSMQDNAVLAEANVRVISRDLRDSRRRRRHVWSIL
jgi:hypothetical protein